MDRLSASFTRDEVCRILDLPSETIDSLLAAGRLLCTVSGGEPHVPADQVETYLRDAMLRLYRAAAEPVVVPESAPEESNDEPVAESQPAPIEQPLILPPSPQPVAAVAAKVDEYEYRRAPRYIPRRQIDGIFSEVRFTIVQISSTGLRIRHDTPLVPGDEAKLSFALMTPPRSFVMRGRVVWTSVARFESGGSSFCISGVKVIEHVDQLSRAIEILRSSHQLQPDRRSKPRTNDQIEMTAAALEGVSDEEIALVVQAAQRFASDPLEASRWYSRARFAVADEQVRREAPRKARDREEVLGIWEYLERRIELPKVAGVLSWVRQSKVAAV